GVQIWTTCPYSGHRAIKLNATGGTRLTMATTQTSYPPADTVDAVRSVERAADILGYLSGLPGPAGVVEMERALGLRRPTLYRLLYTLEGKGLVRSEGEPRRFTVGFRVVELARAWLGRSDFPAIARPCLDRLWR